MSEIEKKDCKYWDRCYQKNPAHHEKYNHPPSIQPLSQTAKTSDEENKTKQSPSPHLDVDNSKKQKLSPVSKSPPSKTDESNELQKSPQPNKMRYSPSPDRSKKRSISPRSKHLNKSPEKTITQSSENKQSSNSQQDKPGVSSENDDKDKDRKEMDITAVYNEVMENLSAMNSMEMIQKRICSSQKAEYEDLLKTSQFIRHMFLVEMPIDFYKFWDFCEQLSENYDKKCLPQKQFEKFGLHLVGPFDYLSGNFNNAKIYEPGDYIRHWRFYYDPPEFQTIFMKNKTCTHYGYWRDSPKDSENLLLAKNNADKGCEFEFVGGNCFETVLYYLNTDCPSTPFNRKQITDMKKSIENYAKENNIALNSLDQLKKERDRKVVSKTFHKAGLVVPFNHKTEVGYRGLIESDANIKKILTKLEMADENSKVIENVLESLQPVITAANIAVDECDFGTSIELGIDLFCSGYKELHDVIRSLLIPGYSMLKKPQFLAIMKAHLQDRRKGYNLSIFG